VQLGAELTDIMIVLNTSQAVKAFASGRQVTLGGNVGIAVGPVGRNMGGGGNVSLGDDIAGKVVDGTRKQTFVVPCYSYAHSKGLFMGISMEGGVIEPRKDINSTFYGTTKVDGAQVLGGGVPPPKQAQELYYALAAGLTDENDPPRYQPAPTGAAAAAVPPTGVQPGAAAMDGGMPTATPVVANPFVSLVSTMCNADLYSFPASQSVTGIPNPNSATTSCRVNKVELAETDDPGNAGGFVGGMGGDGGGSDGGNGVSTLDVDVAFDEPQEGEYPPLAAVATSVAEAQEGDGKGSVAF